MNEKNEEFEKALKIIQEEKYDYDIDLWKDFTNEVLEHNETVERDILNLETDSENMEIINSLFRVFHTIKGLSGFVEINILSKISHQIENILDKCRKKKKKITEELIDLILISNDYIKNICKDRNLIFDEEFIIQINSHINKLKEIEATKEEKEIVKEKKAKKIGEILVEEKIISAEQLEKLLKDQREIFSDKKIGEIAKLKNEADTKTILEALRKQQKVSEQAKEDYIKISAEKIKTLVNLIGELMIIHSQVERDVDKLNSESQQLIGNISRMMKLSKTLQGISMNMQMIPLKSTFQKVHRIARDSIKELKKDVDIIMNGENTEIDRNIAEKILDPMLHLVKNCISHGIEDTEERIKNGKRNKGQVIISAHSKKGSVYIEIEDDGKGLDLEKIKAKAINNNLLEKEKKYTEEEIINVIFHPGFSTAENVTKVSGRGVGMDVVKNAISKIGGKVEIKTKINKGTKVILKIPINMAALNGTIVEIENEKYIFPTIHIKKILRPEEVKYISVANKLKNIKYRDVIIPLIQREKLFFSKEINDYSKILLLILEIDQNFLALPVENIYGRQEIVVKPLSDDFKDIQHVSGASILGDGKVSLIVDVESIFKISENL